MNEVEKFEGIIKEYNSIDHAGVNTTYKFLEIGDTRYYDLVISNDIDYIKQAYENKTPVTIYVSTKGDDKRITGLGYAGKAYIKGQKNAEKFAATINRRRLIMASPFIFFLLSYIPVSLNSGGWVGIFMILALLGFVSAIFAFIIAVHPPYPSLMTLRVTEEMAKKDNLDVIHIT